MGIAWGQRQECMGIDGGVNGDRKGAAQGLITNIIMIVQWMNRKLIPCKGFGSEVNGDWAGDER
eukprot:1731304-Alexandrium_andersonii.AAC.1